ncbi:MAG: hemerythrin family protein [Chromatiaceae bacterium]
MDPPADGQAGPWASPRLAWRDEWCLGIEALDTDHRELVRLLNRLLESQGQARGDSEGQPADGGQGPVEPGQVADLAALIAHLREHFRREEELMAAIRYAALEDHCSEHAMQIAELLALCRDLENRGARRLAAESLEWIKRWCFDHFVTEDRRLADAYWIHQAAANSSSSLRSWPT